MATPIADDGESIRAAIDRIRREEELAALLAEQVAAGHYTPAYARTLFAERTKQAGASLALADTMLRRGDTLTDDEARAIMRTGVPPWIRSAQAFKAYTVTEEESVDFV